MRAIVVNDHGGPEVLTIGDADQPTPGENEVLVKVDAAGVNYIDTYIREGIYDRPLPLIPGFEGTGRVEHDPTGTIAPNTLVAWCDGFGSYAEYVCVPADRLVAVPQGIDTAQAASMLLQGITAHYLVDGVWDLSLGQTCLVTAGAGGVGQLLTQFAVSRGARVIALASTEQKRQICADNGADVVLDYGDDLAEEVRDATDGKGVDVAYDGVGKTTFDAVIKSVRPRGLVCLFGAASGPVDPVDPQVLNAAGSLFLTRPGINAYTATAEEFNRRAQAVTRALDDGTIKITVGGIYDLADAIKAHEDLQHRRTTGSLVLDVSGTMRDRWVTSH